MNKDLSYYMSLNYELNVHEMPENQGGGVFIEIPQLGKLSFCAWGKTFEEARLNLDVIKEETIKEWLETGLPIPEPADQEVKESYSGKFVLRLPKSLHQGLSVRAKDEGVSLNTLVTTMLTSSLTQQHVRLHFEEKINQLIKMNMLFHNELHSWKELHVSNIKRRNVQEEFSKEGYKLAKVS